MHSAPNVSSIILIASYQNIPTKKKKCDRIYHSPSFERNNSQQKYKIPKKNNYLKYLG